MRSEVTMVNWNKKLRVQKFFLVDRGLQNSNNVVRFWNNFRIKSFLKKTKLAYQSPFLNFGIVFPPEPFSIGRLEDTIENAIEPFYALIAYYLDTFELYNLQFTVPYIKSLECLHTHYTDLFNTMISLQKKDRWIPLDGAWCSHYPIMLSNESFIRQRLYGQRFLMEHFRTLALRAVLELNSGNTSEMNQILHLSGIKYVYYINFDSTPRKDEKIHSLPIKSSQLISMNTWKQLIKRASASNIQQFQMPLNLYFHAKHNNIPISLHHITQLFFWQQSGYATNTILPVQNNAIDPSKKETPSSGIYEKTTRYPSWLIRETTLKTWNSVFEILMQQAETISVISGLLGREHFQPEFHDLWHQMLTLHNQQLQQGDICIEVVRDALTQYFQAFRYLHSSIENGLMNICHAVRTATKNQFFSIFNTLGWQHEGYITLPRVNISQVLDYNENPLPIQRVAFSPYLFNIELNLDWSQLINLSPNLLSPNPADYTKTHIIEDLVALNPNMVDDDILKQNQQYQQQKSKEKLQSQFESFLRPKNDLLLIKIPKKSCPESVGLANITLVGDSPVPYRRSKDIRETKLEFQIQNKFYSIHLSKESGYIDQLMTPTGDNILKATGIEYQLKQNDSDRSMFHLFSKKFGKSSSLPPQLQLIDIILLESGPIRNTIQTVHRIPNSASQIATRYSFYHNSPVIHAHSIILWQSSKYSLDLRFNFPELYTQDINLHLGQHFGGSTQNISLGDSIEPNRLFYSFKDYVVFETVLNQQSKHTNKAKSNINTGLCFPTRHVLEYSVPTQSWRIPLIESHKYQKPNKKSIATDVDYPKRSDWSDQGILQIPWMIIPDCPLDQKNRMYKMISALKNPLVAIPSHAHHALLNFFTIDREHIILSHVKEAEQFIRQAPTWFYNPTMADIPIIIRLVEAEGRQTECNLQFAEEIHISKVFNADLLERISTESEKILQIPIDNHRVQLNFYPHEIKTLYLVGKIRLED